MVAWFKKGRNRWLSLILLAVSALLFVIMTLDYFTSIPEGENGSVIVGMMFVLPIMSLAVQGVVIVVFKVVEELYVNLFKVGK